MTNPNASLYEAACLNLEVAQRRAELQEIAPLVFWQNCAAEDWTTRVEQAKAVLELVRLFGLDPSGEHSEDALQDLLKKLRFTEL